MFVRCSFNDVGDQYDDNDDDIFIKFPPSCKSAGTGSTPFELLVRERDLDQRS